MSDATKGAVLFVGFNLVSVCFGAFMMHSVIVGAKGTTVCASSAGNLYTEEPVDAPPKYDYSADTGKPSKPYTYGSDAK